MAFDLRITFTGIIGFVPDKPFSGRPSLVTAVVADGDLNKAADNSPLVRHRAFLKVKERNLSYTPGIGPSGLDSIWYLGNREFRLDLIGDTNPLTIGDISGLPRLEQIAPSYCQIDPNALSGSTPTAKLKARFIIDQGTLESGERQGAWGFPSILSSAPVKVADMSNEIVLTLRGLDEAAIVAEPLGEGDGVSLPLTAPANTTIDIRVCNLCDNNPLEWENTYDSQPDTDFKWHFELLDPENYPLLRTFVEDLTLPYPFPKGKPNARGADCFPVAYPPAT